MRAFAIVIKNNPISEHGYKTLRKSHDDVQNKFPLVRYNAFTPKAAHEYSIDPKNNFRWSWPWEGEMFDIELGVKKKAYETSHPLARVACFLSHYYLWKKAVQNNEAILILEHDARFIRKLPDIKVAFGAISINDPRGTTRKAQVYHDKIQCQPSVGGLVEAPWTDDDRTIVQGLPGNSAYAISPSLAKEAIAFTERYGAWPNDALLSRQNFPNKLFCLQNYGTVVQGLKSTTTK